MNGCSIRLTVLILQSSCCCFCTAPCVDQFSLNVCVRLKTTSQKIQKYKLTLDNFTLLVGLRVRRLGYYDHTQRQLGERALYVFPAKGDATRITCEGPEGAPVLPEDPMARKVWINYTDLIVHLYKNNFISFSSNSIACLEHINT